MCRAANKMLASRSSWQKSFGYSDYFILFLFLSANCCLSNQYCFAFSYMPDLSPLLLCLYHFSHIKAFFQYCFPFSLSFPNSCLISDIGITNNFCLCFSINDIVWGLQLATAPALAILNQLDHKTWTASSLTNGSSYLGGVR